MSRWAAVVALWSVLVALPVAASPKGLLEERRLTLVETLVIDPTRRLVLVRLDNEERLILLGEGRMLETLKARPVRKAATAETT